MQSDPWGWVFALYIGALLYSFYLIAVELPDQHRPLETCSKHPGAAQCVCRGNMPKPKR